MRTFAEKPKTLSQATTTSLASRTHLGRMHGVNANAILHLQRTLGNQAVGRLLEDSQDTYYGHDLRPLPIPATPHAESRPKLAIGTPGDIHEQEADRAAERVMPRSESGVRSSEQEEGSARAIQGRTQPLPAQDRSFFEQRLGHDFSQVRLHSDNSSAEMAAALNADAFTVGRDVYFGAGKLQPRTIESKRLLAHELAHVVQQSRTRLALQPKLKITGKTGDVSRAITLLNSGLRQYRVSVDKSGDVRITQNLVELDPDPQQKALADRLTTIISDAKDVIMTVSAGSKTLGGSYATGDFDIADLETYGIGGLIHEIEEQYQKQVKGLAFGSETTGAHSEAMKAESEVSGAKRGAQKIISSTANADGTLDAVIEVLQTFPDGKVKTMVTTIKSNNIVSVTWK